MKNKIFLLCISFFSLSCLTACDGQTVGRAIDEVVDQAVNATQEIDPNVLGVKNAIPSDYDTTYGEAFDNFFALPTWKYFVGTKEGPDEDEDGKPDYIEENIEIVEFTGYCTYWDTEVKVRLQFTLNKEEGTFKPTFLAMNEVPQNYLFLITLIDKAFEDAPATTLQYAIQDNAETSNIVTTELSISETTIADVTTNESVVNETEENTVFTDDKRNEDLNNIDEYINKIAYAKVDSSLTIRKGPSTDYEKAGKLNKREKMYVHHSFKNSKGDIWYYITAGEVSGYVLAKYTTFDLYDASFEENNDMGMDDLSIDDLGSGTYSGIVVLNGGYLNVRASASSDGKIIGKLYDGDEVEILDWIGDWCQIIYNGQIGYVNDDYIII